MKYFTTVNDIFNLDELLKEAESIKLNPHAQSELGKNKTLGLIFMNPSLRTRMSTQKAAQNLGMNVLLMNVDKDGWALEMEDGAVMNGGTVEHIRDAAAVMGMYCDIIGIRCFPGLRNRELDYSEKTLLKFMKHSHVPVISLEGSTLHPLQSFADLMTIREHWSLHRKPKVVLTWAPHVKALPQAVPNSFAEWMNRSEVEFVIAQPPGYELCEEYSGKAKLIYDQSLALAGADFVYVKNWSSYREYGKILPVENDWLLTPEKMKLTNDAKIMHCLPVRRNLELPDALIDGKNSLVLQQAENRLYAAQAVLKTILETEVCKKYMSLKLAEM